MWKVILTFIWILVVTTASFLTYFGFFDSVEMYIAEIWWEYLVYENMNWDYYNASYVASKIYYSLLNDEKIETYKGFWIFYDNPKNTKKENLKAEVGVILEQKDLDKIQDLEKKYAIKQLPIKQYIVAEFPIRWSLSYILGTIKIYPKLEQFILERWYDINAPIMEIYNISNWSIIYRKEIKKETQNNVEWKEETPHR
jgi:hypothetical protein